MYGPGSGVSGYIVILTFQVLLCVAFSVLTKYDSTLLPEFDSDVENKTVRPVKHDGDHVPSYPRKQHYYDNFLLPRG